MKICVFGGGPTGLRLVDRLSKKGHSIELHEKEDKVGGCWKVDWEDGYYREHAPRVMTTSYTKILALFDRFGFSTKNIYGGTLEVSVMFFRYFYRHLTTTDIMRTMYAIYFYGKNDNRTLAKWMEDNKISPTGRLALEKLGISMATKAEELLAYPFFRSISEGQGSKFVQSVHNDQWIMKWESELVQRENVKIVKNSKLLKLDPTEEGYTATTSSGQVETEVAVCAMPLYGLKDVLEKSPPKVKNNWMPFKDFEKFTFQSSYSGVGFQLHFTEVMPDPATWYAGFTDWNIEVIGIRGYSADISRRARIKDVWSCVVVDTNAVSTYLDKKMNDIPDISDVIEEVLRQLSVSYGRSIHPVKVTVSKGIRYNSKKKYWDMEHSGYNPSFGGALPHAGKLEGLHSVGPHNIHEIAVMENAIRAADRFVVDFCRKKNKL